MAAQNQACAVCGGPLDTAGRCSRCATGNGVLLQKHRPAIPVLVLVLILCFSFTRMVVQWYQERQQLLAARWYQRGVTALDGSQPARSVEDFETALVYAGQDGYEYSFKLAESLTQAGRLKEARSRLLNLRDERPSDARVNLALARVAARTGNIGDAIRYYQGAIEGIWSARTVMAKQPGAPESPAAAPDAVKQRMNTRLELAATLAAYHRGPEAEAELNALAADLPPSAGAHVQLGQAFLKINDARRALAEFQKARQLDRSFAPAEAGAGEANFQLGEFAAARRNLLEAVRLNDRDEEVRQLLVITEQVLEADPFSPGVKPAERARRTVAAYEAAVDRLNACALAHPDGASNYPGKGASRHAVDPHSLAALQGWAAELKPYANVRRLRGRDDYVENMMRFVFATEEAASRACGPPAGLNATMAAIGRRRWRSE